MVEAFSRYRLLQAVLLWSLAAKSTDAAGNVMRKVLEAQDPQPISRGSRSTKTNDANGGRGPRGGLLPRSNTKRRVQEDMGVTPLSSGYGGAGGPSMTGPIPSMMDQVIPVTPTFTPVSPAPTPDNRNITYLPGALTVMEGDLILSQGLTSRLFARSGLPVPYADGTTSQIDFHDWPDGAACFPDNRPSNPGGWIYVSNLEDRPGGVGALTFNRTNGRTKLRQLWPMPIVFLE